MHKRKLKRDHYSDFHITGQLMETHPEYSIFLEKGDLENGRSALLNRYIQNNLQRYLIHRVQIINNIDISKKDP